METNKSLVNLPNCRICLREHENGINLFSCEETSKQILGKILSCFQIIVNFEEYLPTKICSICCEELDCANNFRVKCATFEERYSKMSRELIERQFVDKDETQQIDEYITEVLEENVSCDDTNYEGDTNEVMVEHNNEFNTEISDANESLDNCYKCELCSKTLKTKLSLIKHNASMHQEKKLQKKLTRSDVNRKYQCTECPYSTPHSQTLVNHMRRHNGERPYLCQCGKSFTQAASLSAHKKTHSDTKCYTCPTCGKQFKHAFSLKNHSRVHEDGTFVCDICHKYLKSSQSLRTHKNRHFNVRNFNCEDCGVTFVSASELLNHRQMHSQVMVAECHICGYKTHAKKNLIIHLKRHTGEKSYKCDLCTMTAYTQGDLRRHQRVHSREKPYQCPVCTQRFSHSGSLNQHARKVHNLNYRWAESKPKKKLVADVKQEKEYLQDSLSYKIKQ